MGIKEFFHLFIALILEQHQMTGNKQYYTYQSSNLLITCASLNFWDSIQGQS